MSTSNARSYATNLLDRLIRLDHEVTGAFFEMGQILSAIQHSKLWEILEYESFSHMVEEEMSFTPNTANKYLNTYRHFKRLGYTKAESLSLIREFSFTRMTEYLSNAKTKAGRRAIGNAIKKALEESRQLNFCVNAEQYEVVQRALRAHGATQTDSGRWGNSSDAFVAIMEESAAANEKAIAPLRSVG